MSLSAFKTIFIAVIASSLLALVGCSTPAEKAHNSQTELNERKMEIVDRYEACIEKSTSDEEQAKCEAMLKGAEGL